MTSATKRKARQASQKVLLALTSAALTLLTSEVLFRHTMHRMPTRLVGFLDEGIRVLGQSTKQQVVPRNYVLVVGDSNALGMGDGYGQGRADTPAQLGLTSEIWLKLHRDAITTGASGAGSLRGLVGEPLSQLAFVRASGFQLEAPDDIVALFYEGNDLDNNILDLRFGPLPKNGDDASWAKYSAFIDQEIDQHDPLRLRAASLSWWDRFFLSRFLIAAYPEAFEGPPRISAPPEWSRSENLVRLGNRSVKLLGSLQGPALELDLDETFAAVRVFEESLAHLRMKFPEARVYVGYVPAVLSCYRSAADYVSTEIYHGRSGRFPASSVWPRSDFLAHLIQAASQRQRATFIDTRDELRRVAMQTLIHGPEDWWHLNRRGYIALAAPIVDRIRVGALGTQGWQRLVPAPSQRRRTPHDPVLSP